MRVRLHPYRILVMLMFHSYEFVLWDQDRCIIRTSPLARLLGISTGKLREHCQWLAGRGYIYDLKLMAGTLALRITTPPNLELVDEFTGEGIDFELEDDNSGIQIVH